MRANKDLSSRINYSKSFSRSIETGHSGNVEIDGQKMYRNKVVKIIHYPSKYAFNDNDDGDGGTLQTQSVKTTNPKFRTECITKLVNYVTGSESEIIATHNSQSSLDEVKPTVAMGFMEDRGRSRFRNGNLTYRTFEEENENIDSSNNRLLHLSRINTRETTNSREKLLGRQKTLKYEKCKPPKRDAASKLRNYFARDRSPDKYSPPKSNAASRLRNYFAKVRSPDKYKPKNNTDSRINRLGKGPQEYKKSGQEKYVPNTKKILSKRLNQSSYKPQMEEIKNVYPPQASILTDWERGPGIDFSYHLIKNANDLHRNGGISSTSENNKRSVIDPTDSSEDESDDEGTESAASKWIKTRFMGHKRGPAVVNYKQKIIVADESSHGKIINVRHKIFPDAIDQGSKRILSVHRSNKEQQQQRGNNEFAHHFGLNGRMKLRESLIINNLPNSDYGGEGFQRSIRKRGLSVDDDSDQQQSSLTFLSRQIDTPADNMGGVLSTAKTSRKREGPYRSNYVVQVLSQHDDANVTKLNDLPTDIPSTNIKVVKESELKTNRVDKEQSDSSTNERVKRNKERLKVSVKRHTKEEKKNKKDYTPHEDDYETQLRAQNDERIKKRTNKTKKKAHKSKKSKERTRETSKKIHAPKKAHKGNTSDEDEDEDEDEVDNEAQKRPQKGEKTKKHTNETQTGEKINESTNETNEKVHNGDTPDEDINEAQKKLKDGEKTNESNNETNEKVQIGDSPDEEVNTTHKKVENSENNNEHSNETQKNARKGEKTNELANETNEKVQIGDKPEVDVSEDKKKVKNEHSNETHENAQTGERTIERTNGTNKKVQIGDTPDEDINEDQKKVKNGEMMNERANETNKKVQICDTPDVDGNVAQKALNTEKTKERANEAQKKFTLNWLYRHHKRVVDPECKLCGCKNKNCVCAKLRAANLPPLSRSVELKKRASSTSAMKPRRRVNDPHVPVSVSKITRVMERLIDVLADLKPIVATKNEKKPPEPPVKLRKPRHEVTSDESEGNLVRSPLRVITTPVTSSLSDLETSTAVEDDVSTYKRKSPMRVNSDKIPEAGDGLSLLSPPADKSESDRKDTMIHKEGNKELPSEGKESKVESQDVPKAGEIQEKRKTNAISSTEKLTSQSKPTNVARSEPSPAQVQSIDKFVKPERDPYVSVAKWRWALIRDNLADLTEEMRAPDEKRGTFTSLIQEIVKAKKRQKAASESPVEKKTSPVVPPPAKDPVEERPAKEPVDERPAKDPVEQQQTKEPVEESDLLPLQRKESPRAEKQPLPEPKPIETNFIAPSYPTMFGNWIGKLFGGFKREVTEKIPLTEKDQIIPKAKSVRINTSDVTDKDISTGPSGKAEKDDSLPKETKVMRPLSPHLTYISCLDLVYNTLTGDVEPVPDEYLTPQPPTPTPTTPTTPTTTTSTSGNKIPPAKTPPSAIKSSKSSLSKPLTSNSSPPKTSGPIVSAKRPEPIETASPSAPKESLTQRAATSISRAISPKSPSAAVTRSPSAPKKSLTRRTSSSTSRAVQTEQSFPADMTVNIEPPPPHQPSSMKKIFFPGGKAPPASSQTLPLRSKDDVSAPVVNDEESEDRKIYIEYLMKKYPWKRPAGKTGAVAGRKDGFGILTSASGWRAIRKARRPTKFPPGASPEDILIILSRGDPRKLSINRQASCTHLNREMNNGPMVAFNDRTAPYKFLIDMGLREDIAAQVVKDTYMGHRMKVAIIEAKKWHNRITQQKGMLLFQLAHSENPKILKYYVHLADGIVNDRIVSGGHLKDVIFTLELIADGVITEEELMSLGATWFKTIGLAFKKP